MMITMRYDTAAAAGTGSVTTNGAASPAPLRLVRRIGRENRVPVKPRSTGATLHSFHPLPEVTDAARRALRDQVVLDHLSLVKAIAVRVHHSLPGHVDLDDLVHAGILGLFDAASKYDDTKQVLFRGYAKHRIKGAILDSLREMDWASRDLRRRHKRLEEVTRELAAVMERQPTEAEIAEKMGMDLERWRQVALELRMVGFLSASSRSTDGEDGPAPEFPAAPDSNPGPRTCCSQGSSELLLRPGSLCG